MNCTNYSEARKNLKVLMQQVTEDCDQTIITRQGSEPVVMVSLAEWNALQETAHLLTSAKNAGRLASAIAQLDEGQGQEHSADDLSALGLEE